MTAMLEADSTLTDRYQTTVPEPIRRTDSMLVWPLTALMPVVVVPTACTRVLLSARLPVWL